MGSAGKMIGSGVSILLVVGVVIGVVAVVQRAGENKDGGGSGKTTSTKTAAAICAPTQHKEACAASVKSVSNNPNASFQDYLAAALKATMEELHKAISTTNKVTVNKDDDPHNDQMGVDDCKEFLGYAVEQLEAAISSIGKTDLNSVQERVHEFVGWLTGVYVYQTTCVDQLDKPEYKNPVQDGMLSAQQLTENAIYMFAELSKIAGSLDINLSGLTDSAKAAAESVAHQRRLLEAEEAAAEGYPSWVSSSDRRLLQHAAPGGGAKPHAVVAADGSGQFKSINAAVAAGGPPGGGRFIIYVKAGTYNEIVLIKKVHNIFIYGDGQGKTIITGDRNFEIQHIKTSNTATVGVDADSFMIKSCTLRNTAGPEGHQAVALRIAGENAVVYDCAIESYQDTLYYHRGKQFYKSCVISGTVDYIFGNGRAVIQDSLIITRKPLPNQQNMITADGGLTPNGQHGLVLQNCRIVAEQQLMAAKAQFRTYLGRPWKAYAKTIYMQSNIEDFIDPQGWSIFTNVGPSATNQRTAVVGEYMNTGPGANTAGRNKTIFPHWHVLNPQEANQYTVGAFLGGGTWLPATGVPFKAGM